MHNQSKHSIFGYASPVIIITVGFLTLSIATSFSTHLYQSISADQNDNPRGNFPGRLEGGGSRNTESTVDFSPREPLEPLYEYHKEKDYLS